MMMTVIMKIPSPQISCPRLRPEPLSPEEPPHDEPLEGLQTGNCATEPRSI